jgi:glyoxylase-like metal-dependent hydrolase (beta-lactamase superfamily II)
MARTFRIKLLPALHGDCIWIEYGDTAATRHVLIDGGPLGAFGALRAHVESLPAEAREVELLVVTHIDADHIDGIVKLLRHPELGLKYDEVWFNGWPQLERSLAGSASASAGGGELERGAASGGALDLTLVRRGLAGNDRFRGYAAFVPDTGELPRARLPGGLVITLLSPTAEKLRA